jgi:hypothetical protein
LAFRDLVAEYRTLDSDDLAGMQRELARFLPELVDTYGSATAASAADWYDELRDEARVAGRFRAVPVELPGTSRTDALAGWATATTDRPMVLARAAGGLQRIVANASRDTVTLSAARDPAPTRYRRVASGGACSFCLMLAARTDYRSEESASRVGNGRSRGTRAAGQQFHDHCNCAVVPVWPGQ